MFEVLISDGGTEKFPGTINFVEDTAALKLVDAWPGNVRLVQVVDGDGAVWRYTPASGEKFLPTTDEMQAFEDDLSVEVKNDLGTEVSQDRYETVEDESEQMWGLSPKGKIVAKMLEGSPGLTLDEADVIYEFVTREAEHRMNVADTIANPNFTAEPEDGWTPNYVHVEPVRGEDGTLMWEVRRKKDGHLVGDDFSKSGAERWATAQGYRVVLRG